MIAARKCGDCRHYSGPLQGEEPRCLRPAQFVYGLDPTNDFFVSFSPTSERERTTGSITSARPARERCGEAGLFWEEQL